MKKTLVAFALLWGFSACELPQKTIALMKPYKGNSLTVSHLFVPLEEGVLTTSADPNPEFLRWLMEEKGVRTFVSLRGDIPEKKSEIIMQNGGEIKVFHWSAEAVPPQREIDAVLRIMRERERGPVHVFCKAGVDRTGFIRAWWRLFYQGWSEEEALAEFRGLWHIPNALDEYLKMVFQMRATQR